VSLPAASYPQPERLTDAFHRILEEVSATPGVRSAALLSQMPMNRGSSSNGLVPEGKAPILENVVNSRLCIVTPELFRTLGIRTVRGRAIDASDRRGAQKVMVLNETAAAALFPGLDPIGRRVSCCEAAPDGSPDDKVVVGIAADVRSRGRGAAAVPEFYLPLEQMPADAWGWIERTMYLVVRADGPLAGLPPALHHAVARVDPEAPLYDVKTMEQRLGESEATARFNTLLLSLLGLIGLLLSAVGIYGVISYFVTQRTSEIGVRMALGATRRSVTGLVMRQAVRPVAAGLALGLAGSVAATRLLAAYLVGVQRGDPLTLLAVIVLLSAAALLASFVPARRAAGVEPVEALQG
jgi:putative ABC transport system permease protein